MAMQATLEELKSIQVLRCANQHSIALDWMLNAHDTMKRWVQCELVQHQVGKNIYYAFFVHA